MPDLRKGHSINVALSSHCLSAAASHTEGVCMGEGICELETAMSKGGPWPHIPVL